MTEEETAQFFLAWCAVISHSCLQSPSKLPCQVDYAVPFSRHPYFSAALIKLNMKGEPKVVLCNENQTGERSLHPCLTKDPLEQSTLEVRQVFFFTFSWTECENS